VASLSKGVRSQLSVVPFVLYPIYEPAGGLIVGGD